MIFFIENTSNKSFWTAANDIEVEGVWRWLSGELVRHGAPLWGAHGTKLVIFCIFEEPNKNIYITFILDLNLFCNQIITKIFNKKLHK